MKLSVIIPAHNEEGVIEATLRALDKALSEHVSDYEILVVADHCSDGTIPKLEVLQNEIPSLRYVQNPSSGGFGMAVRCGLDHYTGDMAAVYMADASDSPEDLLTYYEEIVNGAECVFGSRFIKGSKVIDYPVHKLLLNRFTNWLINLLFRHHYNDTTNAFKCYRREVIDGCRPFLSPHFNLTVEIPLKAVIRGYKYKIVPISWTNRAEGVSKLKIKEMGSRYFFIIFYCLLEKWMTYDDYRRNHSQVEATER